jgi:N-formylglutamate amidohydrolase
VADFCINRYWSDEVLTETTANSFEIIAPPKWTVPMVFNSPHSGSLLPDAFLAQSCLTAQQLRASEDSHVDELFAGCTDLGAPMMRSLLSRSYLDLNREPYELDARMFNERLPNFVNCTSPRVVSGLGTIPRTVGEGVLIYDGPISFTDALNRIETIYRPYHRALGALLDEAFNATGSALLVDCHSMPSSAVSHMRGPQSQSIDAVLGDRYGSACAAEVSAIVEEGLTAAGLKVSRNKPYSGGFFTENHGRPRHQRHAIQIEINRALYMNETSHDKTAGFDALKQILTDISQKLANWLKSENTNENLGYATAAE